MLSFDIKKQAQKRLSQIQKDDQQNNLIKSNIKKVNALINQLLNNNKNDPVKIKNLFQLLLNKLGSKIIQSQKIIQALQEKQQELNFHKSSINKQKRILINQKQSLQLQIQSIKQTISKIQSTIKQAAHKQSIKRSQIKQQTQKSLNQIHQKIITYQKQTQFLQKDNQYQKARKKQIQQKLGKIQIEFKNQAEQKDQDVKKQKEELMIKLQCLQTQVAQVTQLNKECSSKQKSNFDKKLSLYLKIKKFPQYSTSFENSAKTIDQCKQELLKGIQRMNQATDTIKRFEVQAKDLCDGFTSQFKRRDERQTYIQKLKKQKQWMRYRIIDIQNKIKQKKKNYQTFQNFQ